jgi:uncharacterized membrane protein required for colicin V production
MDFSDISIGGGIVIVVVLFMLVGMIRGVVRMFFGLLSLTVAALTTYWGFKHGDSIAGYVISNPDPWMSGTVGVIMGLAVFFVARALFGLIIKPIKVVDGKKQNKGGLGAALGVLGGLAFAWFAISGIRYVGNLAELQWLKDSLAKQNKIQELAPPAIVKVRETINSSKLGEFHQSFDFINNPYRVEMAKLKVLTDNTYAMNVAARQAGILKAFGQPDIKKLLETSPELNSYVKDGRFSQLLEAKRLCELCEIPDAKSTLAGSDVTKALGLDPKPKKKKAPGNRKEKKQKK